MFVHALRFCTLGKRGVLIKRYIAAGGDRCRAKQRWLERRIRRERNRTFAYDEPPGRTTSNRDTLVRKRLTDNWLFVWTRTRNVSWVLRQSLWRDNRTTDNARRLYFWPNRRLRNGRASGLESETRLRGNDVRKNGRNSIIRNAETAATVIAGTGTRAPDDTEGKPGVFA